MPSGTTRGVAMLCCSLWRPRALLLLPSGLPPRPLRRSRRGALPPGGPPPSAPRVSYHQGVPHIRSAESALHPWSVPPAHHDGRIDYWPAGFVLHPKGSRHRPVVRVARGVDPRPSELTMTYAIGKETDSRSQSRRTHARSARTHAPAHAPAHTPVPRVAAFGLPRPRSPDPRAANLL